VALHKNIYIVKGKRLTFNDSSLYKRLAIVPPLGDSRMVFAGLGVAGVFAFGDALLRSVCTH
jgi:hypothetical protein